MQVSDTGSLRVNRYGWINIWTAILGHFLTPFPAFFDIHRTMSENDAVTFSAHAAKGAFLFCFFTPLSV
ncbi:MAG TPA: hypothetical protein DCX28_17470 [Enterobacteriaceae bacterium]|nr:hypothetical protein [Enterobacteriaceae bacterium]